MKKGVLSCLLAAALVLAGVLLTIYVSRDAAADTRDPVRVYVVGGYDFTVRRDLRASLELCPVDTIDEVPVVRAEIPTAVVVSEEVTDAYVSERAADLNALLDNGYAVYFPHASYERITQVYEKLAGDSFNMTPVEADNTDVVTAYLFKARNGTCYTGTIISPEGENQADTDAAIVKETQDNYFAQSDTAER